MSDSLLQEYDMDPPTRQALEQARKRTPRYLFRGWSNSPRNSTPVSGGFPELNTTDAITPLAFHRGRGHSSIYNLSRNILADMVASHLCGIEDMETELSSWAASLPFALEIARQHLYTREWDQGTKACKEWPGAYVSVIDTWELWESNPIFWVRSLEFLDPSNACYAHEWLAHGVITGPAHKAISVREFEAWTSTFDGLSLRQCARPLMVRPISAEEMKAARAVAEKCGPRFALAVTLAIISTNILDGRAFRNGIPDKTMHVILRGIEGLEIPKQWKNDKTITTDILHMQNWEDIGQMLRLMRALVLGSTSISYADIVKNWGPNQDLTKKCICDAPKSPIWW